MKCNTADKAFDLLDYTLTITSNKSRYPSKCIELIRYIMRITFEIFDSIVEANSLHVVNEKDERIKLQSQAIKNCDKLSKMVELSYRQKRIGSETLCHWQKMICDVKYMTIKWRDSDLKR